MPVEMATTPRATATMPPSRAAPNELRKKVLIRVIAAPWCAATLSGSQTSPESRLRLSRRSPKRGSALVAEEVLARLLLVGDERAHRGLAISRAHQRLADQDRVDPDPLELVDLRGIAVARLGDDGLARGHV